MDFNILIDSLIGGLVFSAVKPCPPKNNIFHNNIQPTKE